MSVDPTSRPHRKRELRHLLRSRRRGVAGEDARTAGGDLAACLRAQDLWRSARHLAIYLASDGEVPTDAVIQRAVADGKSVYLPAVIGDSLEFRPWRPGEALHTNRYGIGEPRSDAVDPRQIDLMLMPVVGWASDGSRLGMGGGFYDRFLAGDDTRHLRCIGLAYEAQRMEELAALREPWDQALHGVVTESAYYPIQPTDG